MDPVVVGLVVCYIILPACAFTIGILWDGWHPSQGNNRMPDQYSHRWTAGDRGGP